MTKIEIPYSLCKAVKLVGIKYCIVMNWPVLITWQISMPLILVFHILNTKTICIYMYMCIQRNETCLMKCTDAILNVALVCHWLKIYMRAVVNSLYRTFTLTHNVFSENKQYINGFLYPCKLKSISTTSIFLFFEYFVTLQGLFF